MERERVTANGLTFECLRQGEGDRLALCLHGFPDDAGTMEPLLARLADAGFTAVAPYMRGYGPTDPAPDGDYTTVAMAKDAIALADEWGDGEAVLVGHDWGAAGAYAAAAIAPDQFSHLVTLAVPPRFVEVVPDHPRQWLRSWYIAFFQLPWLPERVLRARDFALVEFLWATWSPTWDYPEDRLAAVKDTFREEGTVEAALSYYRQFGRQATEKLADDAIARRFHEEDEDDANGDGGIEVPALVLAGTEDGCIGHELFDDAEAAFAGRCRCVTVDGAGHFLHRERPDVVADEILSFVT
ncbi:alpha/beta hydrolase [Halobacteriales archaeon SW_10_68_16]|jgi:pimeloyl-ACP methyl ester carboxylesterase|nr:MAG: alpha/beta hydrolase [Halobacteriales archaeon SW_10_68_16]